MTTQHVVRSEGSTADVANEVALLHVDDLDVLFET